MSFFPRESRRTEFEASCALDGQTYTQTVKINFVSLPSRPAGVEVGYSNPVITKVGDDFTLVRSDIQFKNGWSVGEETWGAWEIDNEDAVNWSNMKWNQSGIFTISLGAFSENIAMNKTVKALVTEADGTISNSRYIPFGKVSIAPAELKTIEREAFAGTKLTEVDIPAGVSIESDAFDGTGLIAIYCHDQSAINYAVENGFVAVVE